MDVDIDHYVILGLPSGEEGARVTEKEISKAYRLKALELHPDKRPDDPNAHANFQKLKTSYEILKDEKARKLFDDLIRVRKEKIQCPSYHDAKRQKMMSDLEERERAAFAADPSTRARDEEERISRQLRDEIARIRAMFTTKTSSAGPTSVRNSRSSSKGKTEFGSISIDEEKVLKVSWENFGEDYTAPRLREIFGQFGKVEDVVIKSTKKKYSALVVMASKDATVAVLGNVLGDPSSPLLVLPLKPVQNTESPSFSGAWNDMDSDEPKLSGFVGAGYHTFEDSVLEKMMKAGQKQSDLQQDK